jgi:tetratricopeptide (TPR) repeat protein
MSDDQEPLAARMMSLYAAGDLAGVVAAFRAEPMKAKSDADAQLLAGLAAAGLGEFDAAAGFLQKALRARPGDVGAKGALARVFLLQDRENEAAALIGELSEAASRDPLAALHLADTYLQAGRSDDAYRFAAEARRRFNHPLIDVRLAEAAIRTRRPDDAIDAARRLEASLGAHPSVMTVSGPAALLAGDARWFDHARTAAARQGLSQAAATFDKWTTMLIAGDQLAGALVAAEQAAEAAPTAARWRVVCDLRLANRRMADAEPAALAALAIDPRDATAMELLARCRMMKGDIGDARRILSDAVAIDPLCGLAFDYLTQIDPAAMTAEQSERLEAALAREEIRKEQRSPALLALARRYEATGDEAKAFARIIEGKAILANAARKAGTGYRPEAIDAAVDRAKSVFTHALPTLMGASSPRPVFIVGMPRSGTSLVEQVLASHSAVFGAGELPGMILLNRGYDARATSAEDAATLLSMHGAAWRQAYLDDLPQKARGAAVVTDKHPLNFWSVGLIRALFPDAVILNLMRSPTDVCLSVLRLRFFAEYDFANEIDAVAHYYAAYERMAAHWRTVLGDGMKDVSYEALIGNPEAQTRALLAACDLPFEAQCLEFHKTDRDVLTHSFAQVREPINNRAIERRKRYGDVLKPLEDALARYGVRSD